MFRLLGNLVCRWWPLLLGSWAVLLAVTWLTAPRWDTVSKDQEFGFLPKNVPSRQAEEKYKQAYPTDRSASSIVIVLSRSNDQPPQVDSDRKYVENVLEPALRQMAATEGGFADEQVATDEPLFADPNAPPQPQAEKPTPILAALRTPNAPGAGTLMVSPDGRALLVVLELTTEFTSEANWPVITKVEDLVRDFKQQGKLPPGMDAAVTGSAIIGRDHSFAQAQSIRATGALTIILVVVLLIMIYRAPLLALIPLATVFVAVEVSIHILALLAKAGHITLFQGIQTYITILAYGAGVDYCLFLIARYKEELDQGGQPSSAICRATEGVGHALTASAATVICGIGMMFFAQFGKFREAGIAIPLSLAVVLVASLTFSPALVRLVGKWAFWPQRMRDRPCPADDAGELLAGKGLIFRSGELKRLWHQTGEMLVRRPVLIWLATVGLMLPLAVFGLVKQGWVSYDLIGDLPDNSPSVVGTRVLQEHFPAGVMGPVTALLIDNKVDFGGDAGRELVQNLTNRLKAEKDQLGLADIRSLTEPLGITEQAKHPFAGLDVPEDVRKEAAERAARERYVTDLGQRDKVGTRLDLVPVESPFAHKSINGLPKLRQAVLDALPADVRADSQLYLVGTTASVHDLAVVMEADRRRIEILVLASVFVILIALLRRFVVSLYLLLTVLFSYYTTLGATIALFWMLDPQGFAGVDWKVAIFLFTILIAVGEDYNIFLMTRVDEEEKRYGPVRGVTHALERTGPIISSCGIIMAGTFASLLAGSLAEMTQLGFALTFGVLLDTFVVRPILAPAFLILLGSGRLPFFGRPNPEPADGAPGPLNQLRDVRSRTENRSETGS